MKPATHRGLAPGWRHLAGALAVVVFLSGCERPTRFDENLCPVGQPPAGTTILLLDTSDPLEPAHEAELGRLLREMNPEFQIQEDSDFFVAPLEKLVVYELNEDIGALEPSLVLCNPGVNPSAWEWWRSLVQGRAFAQRRWEQFDYEINSMFAVEEKPAQSSSPLIEALGVIVPRHAPSQRSFGDTVEPVHLILYSDLLQHSASLSHYGAYPPAQQVLATSSMRHLGTDLAGVEVSIFRLERARDARWQTPEHYYWWTRLVQEFGGQVIRQESL